MESAPRHRWPTLAVAILCVGAFTTALNTTQLSPLLTPIATDFRISSAAAGQLSATTAATAAVTALVMAPWLDRRSRAFWLRLESLILLLATAMTALAPTLTWLFAARAMAGMGGAFIFAVCLAAASEIVPDGGQRHQVLGVVGTAATLSALLGLPIVTKLDEIAGWRMAVASTSVLAFAVLCGSFFLNGPRHTSLAPGWCGWRAGYRSLLGDRTSMLIQAANVGLSAVWFGCLIYLGAYARERLGYHASALALLYLAGGMGEVVGNLGTPLLLRRFHSRSTGAVLGGLLTCPLLLLGVIQTPGWGLGAVMVAVSLAGAGLFTLLSILVVDTLPEARGAGTALLSAGFELGGVTGIAFTGLVLEATGTYAVAYGALGVIALAVAGTVVFGQAREHVSPAPLQG